MTDHFVERPGVSLAWGRALQLVSQPGRTELGPLTVAITSGEPDGVFSENTRIRGTLDKHLESNDKSSVHTVANTIFPASLWNPQQSRNKLFERYLRIIRRIHRVPQNRHGVYFERMICNGPKDSENQIDLALETYKARKGVRRSVLQIGIFDPRQDHSTAAMRGFPCLQHISFAPDSFGNLSLNAFYATQYMVERAYGNYLGLCWLGNFLAHELGLNLSRVTCHVGVAILDTKKSALREILGLVDAALHEQQR